MRHPCARVLLAALLAALFVPPCRSAESAAETDDVYGTDADFALTERSGRPVQRSDLAGKVWVASFIFTHCQGTCPRITDSMARLQHDLAGQPGVLLVSFSVDPDRDTPALLQKYADQHGADPRRWLFLTGDRKAIYQLLVQSFHVGVAASEEPGHATNYDVTHDNHLVLVDPQGRIRGYFDGTDQEELPRLEKRITVLQWQNRLPEVNAILNGTCTILLLIGYAAVRRRRISLHTTCMLMALVVSMLFLASYLYYHIVVQERKPTPFPGTGWVRPAYLTVLFSHMILAAIVPPMALFTAYQGWCNRLALHVRVARWTLPIWLYVSITGVIVYWMLYRLYPPS